MIPSVKTWQVKYWTAQDSPWHGRVLKARVQTINKRFAKWMANEALGYPAIFSDKVTVGLIKGHTWLGPVKRTPEPEEWCLKCGSPAVNDTPVCAAHGAYSDY